MATLIKNPAGIYQIVFYSHGKRIWRSLSTRDRNLACKIFIEYEKSGPPEQPVATNEPLEGTVPDKTVRLSDAIQEYVTYVEVNLSSRTQGDYKSVMKLIARFFGPDKMIEDITLKDIEQYKADKFRKNVSPHTVNHNLRCIKAFFNRLVQWDYIEKNPCKGVKFLRIDDTIRPYLQREELQKLLAYTDGSFLHPIVVFAVLTGLRQGEIVNLTWDDIILDKRKIIVRSNGSFRTKSGKMRTIPINSEVYKLLSSMQDKTGLLFKDANGKPFRGEFISKRFKRAVRECKLNPKLHFHSLRHTFGSYLVEQGVSLFHVQQLMGHSSPYVTQIYAHLGNAELMSSVEKINTGIVS